MNGTAAIGTVAVIVVNWRQPALTGQCLRSLLALDYAPVRICVIDNGSGDGSAGAIAATFPEVNVRALPENRGYAAACNAGITWADEIAADYVWLLNNDTTVDTDCLTALVDAARRLGSPAIFAPKILLSGASGRIWSAGGQLHWPWLERGHFGAGAPAESFSRARVVPWASGCSLFLSLEAARLVGPMDEAYFLYLEDVDWCLRARRRGVPTWYVPAARVRHAVSESTRQLDSRALRYYVNRNYFRLVFAHGGPMGRAWAAGRLAATLAKTGVRVALFPRYQHDSYYHAQTRGILHFLLGRFGKAPYEDANAREAAAVEA